MSDTPPWTWELRTGRAEDLHDPAPPAISRRTVWEMQVSEPSIVLGSSQDEADIDAEVAAARGLSIARRRSGGGAVLLVPGAHSWFDVWLPAGDPLWVDDVGRSADWLSAAWIRALNSTDLTELASHSGRFEAGQWGRHVCFAGIGPGEVTAAGRKLVGISQRRTREWARFQCMVHHRWDADTTFAVLAVPGAAAAAGAWSTRVAEVDRPRLRALLTAALAAVDPTTPR